MRETTRVLVVEDDADALLLLRLILGSRPGYEVVFCRNPAQALAVAARRRFDVLVTDLHMPGMDGLELAAALRETDPTLPVLLVTAHATIDAAVRAVKGSVTDFLTTPLHPDAVCAAIDAAAHARQLLRPPHPRDRRAPGRRRDRRGRDLGPARARRRPGDGADREPRPRGR